jgi:hypothetical protein
MNRTVLALIALLASCAPPLPPELPAAGWHSLPDEPANESLGGLNFRWPTTSRLEVTRWVPEDQAAPKLYLAARWANSADLTVLTPVFEETVTVDLAPPASARQRTACGERADGLLLAYVAATETPDPATDQLVGVYQKPANLFADRGSPRPFTWDTCGGESSTWPLFLQPDPRLKLALCAPNCAEPLFDRTHVLMASVTAAADRTDFSFWVLGTWPEVRVEVNGKSVPKDELERAEWVEGNNTVRITAAELAPWTAQVVLPPRDLRLTLHGDAPRIGSNFTVTWSAAWADSTELLVWPLDVPVGKAVYPTFELSGDSLTAPFPEFPRVGSTTPPTRAELRLTAVRTTGRFQFSVGQSVITPLAP